MDPRKIYAAIEIAKSHVLAAFYAEEEHLRRLDREDEEDECVIVQMTQTLRALCASLGNNKPPRPWKYPSSSHWWDVKLPCLPEKEFVKHFRVDRATFYYLVEELRQDLNTKDTQFRKAVPVEKKVAIGLKAMGTTSDFQTIGALFGTGRSSAHLYFTQFVDAVNKHLVKRHIKWPSSEDEYAKLAQDFERMWQFPMAIGAIDGSHIPFSPPVKLATNFYNYKGWRSILVLAICDAKGRILWGKAGMPGRMCDSGAFKHTEMYKSIRAGLFPEAQMEIGQTNVPYMLLGDSGFGLEKWLLTPFTYRSSLTKEETVFNYRLSRARRVIENCFGRLKQRFRRLLRGIDVRYKRANKVVMAAMALHNICEEQAVPVPTNVAEAHENARFEERFSQPRRSSNVASSDGKAIRKELTEFFSSQTVQPWDRD